MRYRIQQIPSYQIEQTQKRFLPQLISAEQDTQPADTGFHEAAFLFVADTEGEQIGAAWAWNLDNNQAPAELYVYIRPDYRGYGIGTDLIRTLTDYLALCGYDELFATVRRDNYAVLLFGSVGFRPIREVDEVYTLRLDLKSVGQIELS